MKGDLRIEINDKELAKLVVIAGCEEVYPSINIMKRYISLQGKEIEQKKLDSFVKLIKAHCKRRKLAKTIGCGHCKGCFGYYFGSSKGESDMKIKAR